LKPVIFLGRDQAHQAFEQGGLADAVAPEQAGDFADPGVERQAAKNVAAAVVLVEFFDLEHGFFSRKSRWRLKAEGWTKKQSELRLLFRPASSLQRF